MSKKVNKNKSKKNIKVDNKKIENVGSFDVDFFKVLYLVLGVICVFCTFYIITVFVVVKDTKEAEKNKDVAISLDSTIVGRSMSMPEEKYYVLYYETKNEEVAEKYTSIVGTYQVNASDDKIKLYTVDMSDALNKKYAAEESNTKPNDESDIAIKGTTLIVIENGEVVDYIEDQDRIEALLK
jgi:hypothetical protein